MRTLFARRVQILYAGRQVNVFQAPAKTTFLQLQPRTGVIRRGGTAAGVSIITLQGIPGKVRGTDPGKRFDLQCIAEETELITRSDAACQNMAAAFVPLYACQRIERDILVRYMYWPATSTNPP